MRRKIYIVLTSNVGLYTPRDDSKEDRTVESEDLKKRRTGNPSFYLN